jgi:hypothetical protein
MFDDDDWTHVAIEPRELDEKVDIYWTGATSRAVQVKSSKSRVNETDAKVYIQELKHHHPTADEYELVLCAHVVATLKSGEDLHGAMITINNSQPLDLIQQAAQRLDTFLYRQSISQTPPLIRELLVRALTSRLFEFSTDGLPLPRADFEELIKTWLLTAYPEAARNLRFSMCEISHGPCEMQLTKLKDANSGQPNTHEELVFVSDLYFVNASLEPSIIQFVVFSLTVGGNRHFCIPKFFFDPEKVNKDRAPSELAEHEKGLEVFQPICIVPKGVERRKLVAFSLRSELTSEFLSSNVDSEFVMEVFVKYHHLDSYILAHSFHPNILFDELFEKKRSIAYLVSDIEMDADALSQPIARPD